MDGHRVPTSDRHYFWACPRCGTSEVNFYYSCLWSANSWVRFIRDSVDPSRQRILSASLFLHPGFLIIDHIHFQYNGFMFGILLWSILMAREVRELFLPEQSILSHV
jgi:hypothetical protein